MTITVKYSCALCGLVRAEALVPARGAEDVVVWLEKVCIVAVARDHQRRSPGCRATSVHDLMVPMTGASKVGGPSEH